MEGSGKAPGCVNEIEGSNIEAEDHRRPALHDANYAFTDCVMVGAKRFV